MALITTFKSVADSTQNHKVQWHELFSTGLMPDKQMPTNGNLNCETPIMSQYSKAELISIGLEGWACCSIESPPENFGVGMAKIASVLGTATADNLMLLADELDTPYKDFKHNLVVSDSCNLRHGRFLIKGEIKTIENEVFTVLDSGFNNFYANVLIGKEKFLFLWGDYVFLKKQ